MSSNLSVIAGGRDGQERIALSLVHPRERIDVTIPQVLSITIVPDITFAVPDGTLRTLAMPSVVLRLAPSICGRLHRLTSTILQEKMDIVVGGEVIASPRVLEPIGGDQAFSIGVYDLADAEDLAEKLRRGWARPALRAV
ncbi:SecDF P1 head subdomain-containing protein [Rhodopseudomonas sp.]|uniref:SecDF P1 head subdomain-containing protein n=1 Tax=Rhodopseudomonas sp. TaxID=1078 RepID=UPI003B3A87B4